jgi:hypothetical protein
LDGYVKNKNIMNTLPLFKLTIKEDEEAIQEVNAVALVDIPAIGQPFFAFNKHQIVEPEQIDKEKKFSFSVVNDDERIVVGPAMVPDLPIYRADETGEYYVFFDKKTIETIALKFYAKGFQQNANEMHAKAVDGITFFQSWIADESKGIPKMKQFEDLPDGTWFLGAKIENDETWAKVKDGTFKGFSVEGMFDMTEIKMRKSADDIIAKLRELLADI